MKFGTLGPLDIQIDFGSFSRLLKAKMAAMAAMLKVYRNFVWTTSEPKVI